MTHKPLGQLQSQYRNTEQNSIQLLIINVLAQRPHG